MFLIDQVIASSRYFILYFLPEVLLPKLSPSTMCLQVLHLGFPHVKIITRDVFTTSEHYIYSVLNINSMRISSVGTSHNIIIILRIYIINKNAYSLTFKGV